MLREQCVSPSYTDEQLTGPRPTAMSRCQVIDIHRSLTIRLVEDGEGRVRAAVYGEVDFDCAEILRHVLEDNLRRAAGGVDLDLEHVEFFDCSGLNVLIHLRRTARQVGAGLRVLSPSPAVARVLTLTGMNTLLDPPA